MLWVVCEIYLFNILYRRIDRQNSNLIEKNFLFNILNVSLRNLDRLKEKKLKEEAALKKAIRIARKAKAESLFA